MASKGKGHVDRKRNEYGNLYHRQQVKETIKQNRRQPVEVYRQDSPQFKIYTGR